jgi:hypothetical protein
MPCLARPLHTVRSKFGLQLPNGWTCFGWDSLPLLMAFIFPLDSVPFYGKKTRIWYLLKTGTEMIPNPLKTKSRGISIHFIPSIVTSNHM